MALPEISTPIFSVTLPVSKLEINFRPFLVKEEKVMLQRYGQIVKKQKNF